VPEMPPAISRRICSSEVEVRNCLEPSVGASPPEAARPWQEEQLLANSPSP